MGFLGLIRLHALSPYLISSQVLRETGRHDNTIVVFTSDHPTWPKGDSGITIGIGYDLGYQTPHQISRAWQGKIPDQELERLIKVSGLKRRAAHRALASVQSIQIPLQAAGDVHCAVTLPKYALKTKQVYPGIEKLPADAQSMLDQLVAFCGDAIDKEAAMIASARDAYDPDELIRV